MIDKIKKIQDSVEDIRKVLIDQGFTEAECADISDLDDLIQRASQNSLYNNSRTVGHVGSEPQKPTATLLNTDTGLVKDLDVEWDYIPTSKTGIAQTDVGMSVAIFDESGYINGEGSEPAKLTGQKGSDGVPGVPGVPGMDGAPGEDGKDGKDGIDGSTYEYVYFRGLTENDKPPIIPSGEGNNQDDYKPTYTKTVEIDGVPTILKGEDRAQGVSQKFKYEWRAERSKKDASTGNDFTEPILGAKYGEKGKDGDGVQYIFTITKDFDAPNHPYPTGGETDPEYQNNEADEYIPKPADGQVWKDDPIEVDDINRYCWVSVRKYRNGKGGRYSNPTLWTKWTESSGVITGDVIALDIDPNGVMLNEDEDEVKTTVTAYRGSDKVVIQNITCDENGFTFTPEHNESKTEWYLTFSNIEATSNNTYIKLKIALSDDDVRTKTFTIYHTKFSAETVTLDFKDDNILVPCSDGSTPDSGFFSNFLVPMVMRVNGEEKTIVNIVPNNSTYNTLFELVDNGKSLQVKGFPGSDSTNTVDFTANDADGNSASASLRFTKFNTAGGELVMYTLNVNASDIVANQKNDTYTVYTGQENDRSNIIKVNVNEYSSSNPSRVINLSELDSNYKVFYANDPYDWAENELDEEGRIMSDSGLYIGTTDIDGVPGIAPDSCVAFQLRHWINTNKAINGENCTEEDYEIQDAEILKVDIIQEIASYKFVIEPTFFHKRVNGTIDPAEIQIGLAKNVAGDNGNPEYIPVNNIPPGYDLYYEINGTQTKIYGEDEQGPLPCGIPISNATGDINLYLVTNERSDDEGKVVLSETIEMRSELPGESAYVGYLTDSLGVVSCDADGKPDPGQPDLTTQFKVTNAKSVTVNKPTVTGCNVTVNGNTITFSSFTDALQPTTVVPITATYTDANDILAETEAVYTIVKLRNADSTTVLHVSDNNIIVPCDPNLTPLVNKVTTTIEMSHGDEILTINPSTDIQLLNDGDKDFYEFTGNSDGYVDCEFNPVNIPWANQIYELKIKVTGHGEENGEDKSGTKIGQIRFVKNVPDEGGKVGNLVLSTKSPKYDITTNKFKQDYISGGINIGEGNDSKKATGSDINQSHAIVYKSLEELEDDEVKWTVLTENDFETDGEFRIYINPNNLDKTVADLDTGLAIRFAYKNNDYEKIQEEWIEVSKDGQDFSGLELLLSDTAIYQTWKDNVCETVTPNKVRILGIYEFKGDEHQEFIVGSSIKDENIGNQHISGLDVYYTYDIDACSEYDAEKMHPVEDFKQDDIIKNDVVASGIDYRTITDRLDVYLVADYNPHDEEASNETVKKIIDHKSLEVVPITLPNDAKSYHMELDQDELKVPIDKDGNVDPDFTASIQPYFYIDDDKQTGITFEYSFGTTNYGTGAVNKTFKASDFSGNYNYIGFRPRGYEFYKKCKITKELNPIEIFIDRNVVKREISDNKVHDSITLEAKKWNYDSNTGDSVTVDSVKMNYTTITNNVTKQVSLTASENKYTINLNNNSYEGIDYIKFEIKYGDRTSYEEVGVITDGRDGSAREVIYYKSAGDSDVPLDPTPKDYSDPTSLYQTEGKELPINGIPDGTNFYNNVDNTQILDATAAKWTDDYPGVNDSDCKVVYACERKRKYGISLGDEFSEPKVYAMYVKDGTSGENAWSGRLTDPIEMVSYNSDGTLNGTINSSTTVLASYGGKIANVEITSIDSINGCTISHENATATLTTLPDGTDVKNFNFKIHATGTYQDANGRSHTDSAELIYTVKKWFGEAPTAMVHLSNDSTPVPTNSDGIYSNDIVRTATLTASSGTSPITITNVDCDLDNVSAELSGDQLTITVGTSAVGSSDDVLAVPIICTLDGDYPDQTVTMNFYKVRSTGPEYPDVYDLFVSPNSIFIEIDQTTGEGVYESTTITPTIRKYGADNSTIDYSVTDFNNLGIGSITYSFDGDESWYNIDGDTFEVFNGTDDADEYIDVKLTITGDREQIERVKVSHGQIPNIDGELVLDCPERIPYDYEGNIKVSEPTIACKLCKNINGTLSNVDTIPANFDIALELDGQRMGNYKLGDTIRLDDFRYTCEFILVNQGDESNEQDEVYDRKLVTKELDAEPGKSMSTPIIYPAGDFDITKALKGEYVGNSNQAPYVFYNVETELKGFYIAYGTPKVAPSSSNIITKDKEVDGVNIPSSAANGIEMDNFNAIYSDIGVFQHALVGKGVFHDDYMFSQDGHLGNPKSGSFGMVGIQGGNKTSGDKCSYDLVANHGIIFNEIPDQENGGKKGPLYQHIEFGSGIPNILFNAKTGAGRLGDALTFDSSGIATILKNPVFRTKELTFDDDAILSLNSLENNVNYIFNPGTTSDDHEFSHLVLLGTPYGGAFELDSEKTVRFTNNTDYFIEVKVESDATGTSAEYNILNIPSSYNMGTFAPIGIVPDTPSYVIHTEYLLLYPQSTIELNFEKTEDNIRKIRSNTPLCTTRWMGTYAACTNAFIPFTKSTGINVCGTDKSPNAPVCILEGCNFQYMKFVDNLEGEEVYIKIYNDHSDFVSDLYIQDTTDGVSVPVPVCGTVALYYDSNVDISCNVDARILYGNENGFGGGDKLNFNMSAVTQSDFNINNFVQGNKAGHMHTFYIQIPDKTINVTVKPDSFTETASSRPLKKFGVALSIAAETDISEDPNVSNIIKNKYKGKNGSGNVWTGGTDDFGNDSDFDEGINCGDNSRGSLQDCVLLRLDPMGGVPVKGSKDNVVVFILTAKLLNGTTISKTMTISINKSGKGYQLKYLLS